MQASGIPGDKNHPSTDREGLLATMYRAMPPGKEIRKGAV